MSVIAKIPQILDLWEAGYSATTIAIRLSVQRKQVTAVVAQARSIGDPRAVLHRYPSGRLVGNLAKIKRLQKRMRLRVVPVVAAWS